MILKFLRFPILTTFFISLSLSVSQWGCVSIPIEKDKNIKDSSIQFQAPPHPYIDFDAKDLDKAWKSRQTGNSISYFSDCNPDNDPNFLTIRNGLIADLHSHEILKESYIDFNQRKALESTVFGKVDGVDTKIKLIILKKNSCLYILTYVALIQNFERGLPDFNSFTSHFKVP